MEEKKHCLTCRKILNVPDDPLSLDCGGDCLECVRACEEDIDTCPFCGANLGEGGDAFHDCIE